ncbi:TPA: hypothetical protein NID70_002251 [Pseudomonas aeruginosa]|nr:hypothetical protein [Pseudomonas aeruginosa]
MSNCPHEAWDFGAIQCPDCGAVKDHVTDAEYAKLAAEAQALREEVAALDARERLFTSPENIQVALEAQSRLNGKTVSEGLLRKWLELMEHGDYREGHCMCGSPVDSHGIGDGHAPIDAGEYYAGQVMEELRALLNQDKENGNG